MNLNLTRFSDLPLAPKSIGTDDYSVSIDGLIVGRIMLRPATFGSSR